MAKRSPRPKKPKLPPSIDGYVLAFYDCLEEAAPLEPLKRKFVPKRLDDARLLVRQYNAIACANPKLLRLLALFPLGMFR